MNKYIDVVRKKQYWLLLVCKQIKPTES